VLLNPADSLLHPTRTANEQAVKAGESLRVDINTADAALLETLPMIGPAKAAAIIQYREQHGRFFKSSDIMKVKGIGPGTYEKIEKRITTGNP
jgi:comEA protein